MERGERERLLEPSRHRHTLRPPPSHCSPPPSDVGGRGLERASELDRGGPSEQGRRGKERKGKEKERKKERKIKEGKSRKKKKTNFVMVVIDG